MGADGGTIPTRDELTKLKKKPEKADKDQLSHAKWFTCAVSTLPLKEPIVCDETGRLYNKDKVLEAIISKQLPSSLAHVTSLKDLHPVKFIQNPKYKAKLSSHTGSAPATTGEEDRLRFHCPISLLPVNGFYAFSAQRGCGCVLSDKALREVRSSECVNCGAPRVGVPIVNANGDTVNSYEISLNPSEDVQAHIRARVLLEKAAALEAKKKAKAAKKAAKLAAKQPSKGEGQGQDGTDSAASNAKRNGTGADSVKRTRSERDGAATGSGQPSLARVKKAATAATLRPKGADEAVWSKLFTSSVADKDKPKETFCARAVQRQTYK